MEANHFASDDGLGAPRLVLGTDDDDFLVLLENLERCRCKLHLLISHDVGQRSSGHGDGCDRNLALRLLLVGRWLHDDGALALRWWHVSKSARRWKILLCWLKFFRCSKNRKEGGMGYGVWIFLSYIFTPKK